MFCELTQFFACKRVTMANNNNDGEGSGSGNNNNGLSDRQAFVQQMFDHFTRIYESQARLQEQVLAPMNRQNANGEDQSNTNGDNSNNGTGAEMELWIMTSIFCTRGLMRSALGLLRRPFSPWDANKWIEHWEGIYDVECLDRQKVILVAFKLEEDSKESWKAAWRTFEMDITWGFLNRKFIKKFIPDHLKDQKAKEFGALELNDMAVTKYANKFTEPSHYAKRMKKFIDGLWPNIRNDVRLYEPTTIAAALKKALVVKQAQGP